MIVCPCYCYHYYNYCCCYDMVGGCFWVGCSAEVWLSEVVKSAPYG